MTLSLEQKAADEQTSTDELWQLANTSVELARIVAQNVSASSELLSELAERHDRAICQNIALNPNAPIEVLFKLGTKFPREVLDNPVFTLLLLEEPQFIKQIPSHVVREFVIKFLIVASLYFLLLNLSAVVLPLLVIPVCVILWIISLFLPYQINLPFSINKIVVFLFIASPLVLFLLSPPSSKIAIPVTFIIVSEIAILWLIFLFLLGRIIVGILLCSILLCSSIGRMINKAFRVLGFLSKALIQSLATSTDPSDKIIRSNPSLLPDANSPNLTVSFLKYFLLDKKKDCYFAVTQFLKKRDLRCVEWVLKGYAQSEHSIVRFLTLLHPQLPIEVAIAASNSPGWLERCAIKESNPEIESPCQIRPLIDVEFRILSSCRPFITEPCIFH